MVAIATIADAVPLVGENRTIARLGLEGLRRPVNGGLKALMEVSGLTGGRALAAGDVGFRLGPRINAAGRMDIARDVIELFTCKDQARCKEIAEKLNQLNLERQAEEARIVAEIDEQLAAEPDLTGKYCMVFDGEGWHRGVGGIVASRLWLSPRQARKPTDQGDPSPLSICWMHLNLVMIFLPALAGMRMRSDLHCLVRALNR
jgi:single-stranded-DNA-specific exonuclease